MSAKNEEKGMWKDITTKTISQLIVTMVIGVAGLIWGLFQGWLPPVWKSIKEGVQISLEFAAFPLPVPMVLLLFMVPLCSITLRRSAHRLVAKNRIEGAKIELNENSFTQGTMVKVQEPLKKHISPTVLDYTRDSFLDLVWEWEHSNKLKTLVCFCPKCDRQIVPQQGYSRDRSSRRYVNFSCNQCGHLKTIFKGMDEIQKDVVIEINLKERKGDWSDVVKKTYGVK